MQVLMRWNYYGYQAFLIKSYKLLNKTQNNFQETKLLQYWTQLFVFINIYTDTYK